MNNESTTARLNDMADKIVALTALYSEREESCGKDIADELRTICDEINTERTNAATIANELMQQRLALSSMIVTTASGDLATSPIVLATKVMCEHAQDRDRLLAQHAAREKAKETIDADRDSIQNKGTPPIGIDAVAARREKAKETLDAALDEATKEDPTRTGVIDIDAADARRESERAGEERENDEMLSPHPNGPQTLDEGSD